MTIGRGHGDQSSTLPGVPWLLSGAVALSPPHLQTRDNPMLLVGFWSLACRHSFTSKLLTCDALGHIPCTNEH
jgi:hypothetical protein